MRVRLDPELDEPLRIYAAREWSRRLERGEVSVDDARHVGSVTRAVNWLLRDVLLDAKLLKPATRSDLRKALGGGPGS